MHFVPPPPGCPGVNHGYQTQTCVSLQKQLPMIAWDARNGGKVLGWGQRRTQIPSNPPNRQIAPPPIGTLSILGYLNDTAGCLFQIFWVKKSLTMTKSSCNFFQPLSYFRGGVPEKLCNEVPPIVLPSYLYVVICIIRLVSFLLVPSWD